MSAPDSNVNPVVLTFAFDSNRIGAFNSDSVIALPLSSASEAILFENCLAAVVVSLSDKAFSSLDELNALERIQGAGVPAIAFFLGVGLDEDEIAEVISHSLKAIQARNLRVELISGTDRDLRSRIGQLRDDSALLDSYKHRRAQALEDARTTKIAVAEAATREDFARYLNVRIACQQIVDEAKAIELAIDRALADSLKRVNEGELFARLVRELKTRLERIQDDMECASRTPEFVSAILSTWQVERVNNFLHDVNRFADVDVTFLASESAAGMNIVATIRQAGTQEKVDRTIRVGGTAMLTKVAIATFIPVLAPVAIPIAIGTAVLSWMQWSKMGRLAKLDRFVHDIHAEILAEVRNAAITVIPTLRTTANLAKTSVRDSARERLRDLLDRTPTMSDQEASQRVGELSQHLAR